MTHAPAIPTEFAPGLVIQGFNPPLKLGDFKLIAFDMDATLINIECVDEIADDKESQLAAGHPCGPLGHDRQPPPGQQSPRADCQPSQQRVDQRRQPLGVAALPLHHNNPFDGLLVAQALAEPLRLITHNAQVARYSGTTIAI